MSLPRRRWLLVCLAGAMAWCATACDRGGPGRTRDEPGPTELRKRVERGALLIDVRTPEEFAEGHVTGAVDIPVDTLEARLPEVERLAGGAKDKEIVVYCRSGRRAGVAKGILEKAGYTRVYNLGGLSDWPEPGDISRP